MAITGVSSASADIVIGEDVSGPRTATPYAWLVLALTLGLLLSDYMSRQLLNAIFPLLKADWRLSDTQLGSLAGIVPLAVGVLTLPLSLVADRIGRARSIAAMAILWSVATIVCGVCANYGQMFLARLAVGIGEAAYGSVGVAVVVSVFPRTLRATIVAMFTAGGLFGSVLGLASGGAIAQQMGWRWAFFIMGAIGLGLGALYPFLVKDAKTDAGGKRAVLPLRQVWSVLFPSRTIVATYVASGLQLFIPAALMGWGPSFLNRYYALGTAKAGALSAALVLCGGVGMIACGALADWASRRKPGRQLIMAAGFCLASSLLLLVAFRLPLGVAQLVLMFLGMALASGSLGPAGAAVAARSDPVAHASVFATLTLANNFLGLAPGPWLTGVAADHWGLLQALQLAPLAGLLAAAGFWIANLPDKAGRAGPSRS